MRTVRRLYFYAVAFVSLEIVLWGLIGLARSALSTNLVGGSAARLAQALALVLVGVPVFGLHWWVSQRGAVKDIEERSAGVRAVFLYAVLLSTLIPIVQNFLALLNRLLLGAFGMAVTQAMFGGNQSWTDNLIAMLMNALVAVYFISILRADWKVIISRDSLADMRRVYRFIWVIYTLVMVTAGIQQVLRFALDFPPSIFGIAFRTAFVNGLTMVLLGTPLWYFAWKTVQDSLFDVPEQESLLRLGALYFLALVGVITVLVSGGIVADVILRGLFGERMNAGDLMRQISGPLSLAIPLAGVWAYYGHWLNRTITGVPDAPRRAGMRRLYYYILSLIGLGATFIGLSLLLSFVVDAAVGSLLWADTLRPRLAISLATILVSLPLWWLSWHPMLVEALGADDPGDHARRSLVRKVYLYLVMFVSVIGGMISAVSLLFLLLRTLLGDRPPDFGQSLLNFIQILFLFVMMGVYHSLTLRRDGQMAASTLASKHADFPVLIIDPGDGLFGRTILEALQKQTPRLPAVIQAAIHPVARDASPKAVILPSDLALDPPEPLRKWLGRFKGSRLLVPRLTPGWVWTGEMDRSLHAAAGKAAQIVRQLAEGQENRPSGGTPGWMITVYIFAGLFGLEILMALISLTVSLFSR